ncbi:MAG TPA: sugar ABC transporter permease [Symbiobacteriaceae bacterium]|nr:sugar ABC transporter permease [Symbiobacteriaceae bacterium]
MNTSAARRKRGLSEKQLAYVLVAPALLIIFSIALFPILRTFWISLHFMQAQMPGLARFIGLSNYVTLISDARFWAALKTTVYFAVVSVGLETVLGLAVAMLINREFRGRGLVRAAILVPWAIPTVVSAMMWRWMFNDQYGVVNDLLSKVGLIHGYHAFLGEKSSALWAIIISDVWKTTPFMALLLLAGLQVISSELYEAANVDGASKWRQFWHITLPLLKPAMLVALLFRSLDAFRVFDLVYVLTGGGPGNATETLSVYAYKTLFSFLDFGKGSALAVLVFLLVLLVSFIYIKALGADPQKR